MKFIVTFTPDEDGGYTVECPALPGCTSHGDTVEDATTNIREAIELSLETRREMDIPGYEFATEVDVQV